jgi:hypothetical protein
VDRRLGASTLGAVRGARACDAPTAATMIRAARTRAEGCRDPVRAHVRRAAWCGDIARAATHPLDERLAAAAGDSLPRHRRRA